MGPEAAGPEALGPEAVGPEVAGPEVARSDGRPTPGWAKMEKKEPDWSEK